MWFDSDVSKISRINTDKASKIQYLFSSFKEVVFTEGLLCCIAFYCTAFALIVSSPSSQKVGSFEACHCLHVPINSGASCLSAIEQDIEPQPPHRESLWMRALT